METAPASGAGAWVRRALPFLFILVLFVSYSNTFTSPPYLDDFHSFIFNSELYLDKLSISSIFSLFHTKFGYTRSIPVITLALNHKLGHSDLVYFHLVNILIHVFAFLAVYFLVRQLVNVERKRNPDTFSENIAGWLPICVAALWALSPVQTNAVTYLVQRMASLQALFYFLAVGFYLKGRSCSLEEQRKKAVACYAGLFLSAICAFLSKENSLLLPVMLAVCEIWFFDSRLLKTLWASAWPRRWKLLPVLAAAAIICGIYGLDFVRSHVMAGYSHRYFTLSERLLTEGRVVIWYISLLLWPDPGRMSMEHSVDLSTSIISPVTTLFSFLAIAALLGISLSRRKRYPLITFGIMWYFINMAMESTFIPLELVFEHRLYLPSFGIFLSVAVMLELVFRYGSSKLPETDYQKLFCSMIIVLASCSALMTFLRNEDWKYTITIQQDDALKAPASPRANANYANALMGVGRHEEAREYAEKALQLGRPGLESYGVAANAIVISLMKAGHPEEAVERGEELLANRPKSMDGDSLPFMCINLAQTYMLLDRERDAYRQLLQSFKFIQMTGNSEHRKDTACATLIDLLQKCRTGEIDLNGDGAPDPGAVSIPLWIARELQKNGDPAYSAKVLERGSASNPDDAEIAALVEAMQKEEALNRAQKAKWNFSDKYVHRPFSRFNFCMASAYLAQERQMGPTFLRVGQKLLQYALTIKPDSPDALLLAGWYAFNDDKPEEAVSFARRALDRDPDNAKIWLGLSFFLAKVKRSDEALAAIDKVIELYPGYSRRQVLETLRADLKKGEFVPPVSESRHGAGTKTAIGTPAT